MPTSAGGVPRLIELLHHRCIAGAIKLGRGLGHFRARLHASDPTVMSPAQIANELHSRGVFNCSYFRSRSLRQSRRILFFVNNFPIVGIWDLCIEKNGSILNQNDRITLNTGQGARRYVSATNATSTAAASGCLLRRSLTRHSLKQGILMKRIMIACITIAAFAGPALAGANPNASPMGQVRSTATPGSVGSVLPSIVQSYTNSQSPHNVLPPSNLDDGESYGQALQEPQPGAPNGWTCSSGAC
jgi:hypothetical protein